MGNRYDCIIIGAGSMGMAAGYYLAAQGKMTLLIDAFDPPHGNGSHHGDTRIIRHAYGEGRGYVPLALRSQELWGELEKQADAVLFNKTGVLNIGPSNSVFINEIKASANIHSLALEVLSEEQIHKRWPGWTIPEGYVGCYEPNSGVLFSESCIKAYRELAIKHGAKLLPHTKVEKISPTADGVEVQAGGTAYWGDSIIMAAGAWNGSLLASLGIELPLQPIRKAIGWFQSEEMLYGSDHFPAFTFNLSDKMFYGFPSFEGAGVKLGRHESGQPADPDQLNREFGAYPEDEGDLRSFLEVYLKQASGKLNKGKVCMYTLTPDEHFIIDHHPDFKNIVIAAGFSGHGFKFASGVGEILSQLIVRGRTDYDLSMFSLARLMKPTVL